MTRLTGPRVDGGAVCGVDDQREREKNGGIRERTRNRGPGGGGESKLIAPKNEKQKKW